MYRPTRTRTIDLGAAMSAQRKELGHAKGKGWYTHFRDAARVESVPLPLLLAVASRESRMGMRLPEDGVHPGGEYTIMAINPTAHPEWARSHAPTDHVDGIYYASSYLRDLKNRKGIPTWDGALVGYNAGPSDAKEAEQTGYYDRHTTGGDYVTDVQQRRENFEQITEPVSALPIFGGVFKDPMGLWKGQGDATNEAGAGSGVNLARTLLFGGMLTGGAYYAAKNYFNRGD